MCKTHAMPRYNWNEVQKYYDEGHSYSDCRERFGFSSWSWSNAIRRGCLKANPSKRTAILSTQSMQATRWNVRVGLLKRGLLRYECYECGISEWFGERLPLHVDHINGISDDHRLENLRMLCPNCHSQTETFGAKNLRIKKRNT